MLCQEVSEDEGKSGYKSIQGWVSEAIQRKYSINYKDIDFQHNYCYTWQTHCHLSSSHGRNMGVFSDLFFPPLSFLAQFLSTSPLGLTIFWLHVQKRQPRVFPSWSFKLRFVVPDFQCLEHLNIAFPSFTYENVRTDFKCAKLLGGKPVKNQKEDRLG